MVYEAAYEVKKRYLGNPHPGQELCWAKITIGENAIVVSRFGGIGHSYMKCYTGQQKDALLAKLRAHFRRITGYARWRIIKKREHVHLVIHYPSQSWVQTMTPVRWPDVGSF